jgi:hemerythrin
LIFSRFDWDVNRATVRSSEEDDRIINKFSDKIDDLFTTHVKRSDAAITDSLVEAGSKASFVDTCSM